MKTKILILISLIFAAAMLCQPAVAQDEFKPITVFLIRHAERVDEPKQDPPLSKAGIERSQALARLLSNAGIKAILTSQYARTKQTAEPLATKLGITVTPFTLKVNPSNPRQITDESTAQGHQQDSGKQGRECARNRPRQLNPGLNQNAGR